MSTGFYGKRFLAALSFLTIFPLPEREEDAGVSLAYFPLVGFLLGCLLWVCAHAFEEIFYAAINAMFIVSILTILTRGHTLDGFAAALDGLARGRDMRDIQAVMREDQRGSFGIMGLVLAILAKYLLISNLIEGGSLYSLLFFPTLGRWSMVCSVWFFPASQEEGFASYPTLQDFWWATGITLVCSILTHGLVGLGIMVLAWVIIYGIGHYFVKRTGSITAPVMGAGAELVEILALAVLVARQGGV